MIDINLIEKFYSKMFTTPKKRFSVALGLTTILLASLLNGTVSKSFFAQRYFIIGLFAIIYLLLAKRYVGLAFNSRRVFFLSLILLIIVEVFDFTAIHILHNFPLIVVAPATATALMTITLFFTSEGFEKKILLAISIIFLALYPISYVYSFQAEHRFTSYLIVIILGTGLGYFFIKFLDRNYGAINTKKLLKSFLLFWLTSDPVYFEKELEKSGYNKIGWTKCLRIGGAKLISTAYHPGPVRNIGGATMVSRILNEFEGSMYLHSASKHEDNPVSKEEVNKIISSIRFNLESETNSDVFVQGLTNPSDSDGSTLRGSSIGPLKTRALRPFELEGRRFTLKVFPFEDLCLLLFSGKEAIDDIPSLINLTAESNFGEFILVDSHNAYMENYELSAEEFFEMEELIRKAAEIWKKMVREAERPPFESFFYKKRLISENSEFAAVLFLRYSDDIHAILMVDGNNIKMEFRKEVEKIFKNKGIHLSLLSTDNHSKTGVSPKVGYVPVGGSSETEEIYGFIDEAFEKLHFSDANISFAKNEVIIRTMGREFFYQLDRAFRSLGGRGLYLLCIIVLVHFFAAIWLGINLL